MDRRSETQLESWLALTASGRIKVAVLGIIVAAACCSGSLPVALSGHNDQLSGDFLARYVGARLAWTGHLYDLQYAAAEQIRAVGGAGNLPFIQLPSYAAILSPLGLLPFPAAYGLWQACLLLAVVSSILLWDGVPRSWVVVVCCWSYPLVLSLVLGQDVPFLLLLTILCLRNYQRRPFATGLLSALFSIKAHLFLLWPLLLIGQRRWRMAKGFALGATMLVLLSFSAAGLRWPAEYCSLVTTPALTPRSDALPNLNGLFLPLKVHLAVEIAAAAALGAAAWITLRRTDFRYGLAVVLVGGVLIGHHSYVQDCVLLIPALLIVSGGRQNARISALCLALLTPAPYLLLWNGFWIGLPARLLLLALFCVAVSRSHKVSQNPTTDAALVLRS